MASLIQSGYAVLRDMPTRGRCDQVVADYYAFCDEQAAHDRGRKSRVVNFHIRSEAARDVLLDHVLMRVLDAAFGVEAVLWTSLTFEYGTEQRIHRDSPFFETRPFGYYVGVWTALEDINPESGPLAFVPGGHRVACTLDLTRLAKEYLAAKPAGEAVNYDGLMRRFFDDMDAQCAAAGLRAESIPMNKGDKLIWHHWLPHGGSPVIVPELTRRSLVGHYIPMHVPVFNVDVFFGMAQPDLDTRHEYHTVAGRSHVVLKQPFFQKSYI